MTVFISIPWFHPAFRAGGPIQSIANLVKEYHENIEYMIFCGNTDLNQVSLENIEPGKWTQYNVNTKVWYAEPGSRSDQLTKLVESSKPDILFIIGIFSWHFNIVPLLFCKTPRKILSVRGMLHPGALTQKPVKKKIYLALFKLLGLHKKICFHATDAEEEKYIKKVFGEDVTILIAGNFPRKFTAVLPMAKENGDTLKLVSIALIGPVKNHLLVLQALSSYINKIEYHIYGPVKDMEYWQLCLDEIKKLPQNILVEYHGEIQPQEVESCLQKGHVFILPSLSENFGHSFYEALTEGKPVISSNYTPWQNLQEAKAGINVEMNSTSVRNAIDHFAAMNQAEYNLWCQGAIQYAEAALNIDAIKKQYGIIFGQQ